MKIDKIAERLWLIIKIVLVLFVVCLGLNFTYKSYVETGKEKPRFLVENEQNIQAMEPMRDNAVIEQTFAVKDNEIQGIQLRMRNSKQDSMGEVEIRVINSQTGHSIGEWTIKAENLTSNESGNLYEFLFDAKVKSQGDTFTIQIKPVHTSDSIVLYQSTANQYNGGNIKVNGAQVTGDLAFKVIGGNNHFVSVLFWLLFIIMLVGGIVLFSLIRIKRWKIERIFLIAALILGVLYMVLLPPYSTPDERGHISTVFYYSNILLGQEPVDEKGDVLVRNEDLFYNETQHHPNVGSYGLLYDHIFDKSTDNTMVSYGRTALSVPFTAYMPQILGVTIARILHMGNVPLLLLGRFFGLLFCAICGFYTIKFIPWGKRVLFVVGLLPGTLQLGASFSYDMVVNSLSFLFIAYSFYLIYEKEKVQIKDWFVLGVLMLILAPIKVIYVILILLCLLIPIKKCASKKQFVIGSAATAVSGIGAILIMRLTSIVQIAATSQEYWGGEEGYTIDMILQHPVSILRLAYNSFRQVGDAIIQPVLGGKIGVWDIDVPWSITMGFVLLLFLAVCLYGNEKMVIGAKDKLVFILIVGGVIAGCSLAMLLDFTSLKDLYIKGIQGRYLIPIIPLAVFLLQGNSIRVKPFFESKLLLYTYLLNTLVLWRVFETVIQR